MFQPHFSITNQINNSLLGIERARGFLEATKFKEAWLKSMRSQALILEAHHSTHIEGTELTLLQARKIFMGQSVAGVKQDDRQELTNYIKAIDFVSEYLGKKADITEELVKEIHKILVKDVRGETLEPGRYRKVQNYVVNSITRKVIYTPPPHSQVKPLMREFIKWLNEKSSISPVLLAGIGQYQFVDIHPFLDGNGRTARVLCTLILYQNGYDFKRLFSLSEYYDKNRRKYYDAIQTVRRNNMDMTEWLEYFADGLTSQLSEVKIKGERAIKKEVLSERTKDFSLNQRQKKALAYLVEHHRIDNSGYQKVGKTTRKTSSRDLTELVQLGLLERHGKRKGTYYTLKL